MREYCGKEGVVINDLLILILYARCHIYNSLFQTGGISFDKE